MFKMNVPVYRLPQFDKLMNENNVVYRVYNKIDKTTIIVKFKTKKELDQAQKVTKDLF